MSENTQEKRKRELATLRCAVSTDEEMMELAEVLREAGYEVRECVDHVPEDYGVFNKRDSERA